MEGCNHYYINPKTIKALDEMVKMAYKMADTNKECKEPCGMNYCDENGCTKRERDLVGDPCEPLEPTIPLSKVYEFTDWCSKNNWQFYPTLNYWVDSLSGIRAKTTSELLEIFRSGKENLND